MSAEELDKLRLDDIDFFAHRYAELFGEHFDKNTPQEKEEFYREIKSELLEKAPRYVIVDTDPLKAPPAQSYPDRIELSGNSGAVGNRDIRIHELFHSYNHMENGQHGLKDFDNDLVLLDFDEGSTEMFAQMICGNFDGKPATYDSEVKLTRFLTSIVGERTMIRSTRGNPQLLCEVTDRLLGTQGLVQNLSRLQREHDDLVNKSWGEDSFGTPVSADIQILAQLKLEETRGKDAAFMLFDAVKQSNNQELYNNLVAADKKFGYNVLLHRSLYEDKFNPQKTTLASVQQEILRAEIDELDKSEEISLQTVLEMEIKKFLYDRISFQKHFLDHPTPEYGTYELTPEDTEFSENFRSDLDGASERLGGKLGLVGPGCFVYSLENTPHIINEDMVRTRFIPGVGFDELQDYRLEIWAERLNIAQTREFLNQWTTWTYNAYYREMFPDGDESSFEKAIEEIKKHLDKKEQELIAKYKALESETQETVKQDTTEIDSPIEQVQTEEECLDEQNEDEAVALWTNRFGGWYNKIDQLSQSIKATFVKLRSDIIKAISKKTIERTNKEETDRDPD